MSLPERENLARPSLISVLWMGRGTDPLRFVEHPADNREVMLSGVKAAVRLTTLSLTMVVGAAMPTAALAGAPPGGTPGFGATSYAPPPPVASSPPPSHPAEDRMGSTIRQHERVGPAPDSATLRAQSSGAQPKGMDVSSYQRNVDWNTAAANGAEFAYVKATEGTGYLNPYFGPQYSGARGAGMIRGAYHFALPDQASGAAQANYFVDNGGGWSTDGWTLPPMLDIEYNPYAGNSCYGLNPGQMSSWIADFSTTVYSRTGRYPAIYTTTSWWNLCTGSNPNFGATNPLFIARYSSSPGPMPAGWTYQTLWQYSDTGVFPGDQDVFNGSTTDLQTFASQAPGPAVTPNGNAMTDALLWQVRNTASPGTPDATTVYGGPSTTALSCDFNGDGRADVAIYDHGHWIIRYQFAGGTSELSFDYGWPTGTPVCGKWDGGPSAGIGVFENGAWYLKHIPGPGPADHIISYGFTGALPVVGDWDGNGTDTLGVYSPPTALWMLRNSNTPGNADAGVFTYGWSSATPVVGHFKGPGPSGIGVFDSGAWWLRESPTPGAAQRLFNYGDTGYLPVTGDFSGSGTDGIGVITQTRY